MKATEQDVAAWLEEFRDKLRWEKNYSPHTISGYSRDIKQFLHWLGEMTIELQDVQENEVRHYAAHLFRRGRSPRSIQRSLSSLRGFYHHLIDTRRCKDNPADGVRAPRKGRRLPEVLDVDTIMRLLDADRDGLLGRRDMAMFELLYSSGMRLAELVGLDTTDLDLEAREVRVLGKGRKERLLPVGLCAGEALRRWLAVRPEIARADESALFIGKRGARLSTRSVQARLRQFGQAQGCDQNLHPHLLRHSFASHLLESSGDLRAVQELLGHQRVSTTQIYTHLDFQRLAAVYDAAHPRARRHQD